MTELYNKISNAINADISKPKNERLACYKFERDSLLYETWLEKFSEQLLGDYKLHSDTTSGNCFTAFFMHKIENQNFSNSVTFYIQKSILGDFVTFHIRAKCNVHLGSGTIIYPRTTFISPMEVFQNDFDLAWKYVKSIYPNIIYVPARTLRREYKSAPIDFITERHPNIYRLLFSNSDLFDHRVQGDMAYHPDPDERNR